MSMIFEISIFKLAKISSKILDTKKNLFFVELCNEKQTNQQTNNCSKSIKTHGSYLMIYQQPIWNFYSIKVRFCCVFIIYCVLFNKSQVSYMKCPPWFAWVSNTYIQIITGNTSHDYIWDKVLKNGPSKTCVRRSLKNLKRYSLLKQTISLQIF